MVGRRAFVLGLGGLGAGSALAQVDVGSASSMARLVPAQTLERAAAEQYAELLAQARRQGVLARMQDPQLLQLHAVARKLIPFALQWNERSRAWRWEVNLIRSREVNAFCMPGGKIVFHAGILDRLRLSEDEIAMVMGHEMAHALREHARERLAKTQATNIGINLGAQLLGLGDLGRMAAHLGGQLLTLKFSRSDEREADLVGLELAARAGYDPQAALSLWRKMGEVSGAGGAGFLSTHPAGPERIASLQKNLPKVQPLYEQARTRQAGQ
ncbi:M48 family metallopeptidase [Comamonas flocculans]|nr:M48 family metallopeptidase [Comamonas flocculans]